MTEVKRVNRDKFVVRLPEGCRDTIKTDAHNAKRSMNNQIIYYIELGKLAEAQGLKL